MNCTVWGNEGGGVTGNVTATSCLVWDNAPYQLGDDGSGLPTAEWSNVQGGASGATNIDEDPLVWGPESRDLRLRAGSPCIDAGDPAAMAPDDSRADIGAFAFDALYVGEPGNYCTGKETSEGCTAAASCTGAPSVTVGTYEIRAELVPANTIGLPFLSHAPASTPHFFGTLCIGGTLVRQAPVNDTGSGPCGGTLSTTLSPADLVASGFAAGDRVYAQWFFRDVAQPDGTWSEEADARGLAQPDSGTGAVFFDVDRDGDQDLLVGHVGWREGASGELAGEPLVLYANDGAGSFERVAVPGLDRPLVAYTLTVFDADGDGWLDVHVCGYGRVEVEHNDSWVEATNGSPNALLRNFGADDEGAFLGFSDVSATAGITDDRWSYAAAAADVDEDGDMDLYIANDYGSNRLWINDGGGTFTDGADTFGLTDTGNGMGVSFGDLSGDGRLDVYVSNMSSTAGNRILRRLGDDIDAETHALLTKLAAGNSIFVRGEEDARFERLPADRGGIGASWAWSPALVDLDRDGDLDVFCTNGFVTGKLAFDT